MLCINFLFCIFLLIFNYNYLIYYIGSYLLKYIIYICVDDNYWTNSTDIYMNTFGKVIYLFYYIYYIIDDTTIIINITYIYNLIYNWLYFINFSINNCIKQYMINYFFKKITVQPTTKNIDLDLINILQNNLKLIQYIESVNMCDIDLTKLLNISKQNINTYLKKNVTKSNNIISDIKLYNK
mgnify:CR=1 FL=1